MILGPIKQLWTTSKQNLTISKYVSLMWKSWISKVASTEPEISLGLMVFTLLVLPWLVSFDTFMTIKCLERSIFRELRENVHKGSKQES